MLIENRPEFYVVPHDERLVAHELLLFENTGDDDLESFVSTDFSKARGSVPTGWEDGVEKQRFIECLQERMGETIGDQAEVTLTGSVAMIATASSESLIQS